MAAADDKRKAIVNGTLIFCVKIFCTKILKILKLYWSKIFWFKISHMNLSHQACTDFLKDNNQAAILSYAEAMSRQNVEAAVLE